MKRRPQIYNIKFRSPLGREAWVYVIPSDLNRYIKQAVVSNYEILAIRRCKDWRIE